MIDIAGCDIVALEGEACRAWLIWVLGGDAPAQAPPDAWLLCHCDSGVTWGRFESRAWRLGSEAFPDLCPTPEAARIQEMRIFSPTAETLLWRDGNGLRGRILSDKPESFLSDDPLRPDDEHRILISGSVSVSRYGSTHVRSGAGLEQAIPFEIAEGRAWPKLHVRHYFSQDPENGCVRVAATRLVEVR
jgi:CRISPR-associated protein (TIGR03984 family)